MIVLILVVRENAIDPLTDHRRIRVPHRAPRASPSAAANRAVHRIASSNGRIGKSPASPVNCAGETATSIGFSAGNSRTNGNTPCQLMPGLPAALKCRCHNAFYAKGGRFIGVA